MDKEQRVYKSSNLPFSQKLDISIEELKDRVEAKKASMILIDGGLGEGKTTLMVHILDYVNSLYGLPEVDLVGPQIAMGGADFLSKIRLCYEARLPCIGYDEAGDFSRRGSLTAFNSMLNRTFETFRAFKCLVIVSLPNFNSLDSGIFDKHIPQFLLHLKNRSANQGNYGCYSLYRMLLLRAKMGKYEMKNYAYAKIHPNFIGHFLDLGPERSKQLDILCTKSKLNILRRAEMQIDGLISANDFAKETGKTPRWARMEIAKRKIEPAQVTNNTRYYKKEVLIRKE